MERDIFSHANGNRKRVYALGSWTVIRKVSGWYMRKTDDDGKWKGPYGSETSVCLMISRQLMNELRKRDGLPN